MSWRHRLSRWFDDDAAHTNQAARPFNLLLAGLIVVNVAAVILETVEPIRNRYELAFSIAEHAATAIFTVEYLLRLWTIVELRDPRYAHPVWGRLCYLRSFFALVDLVAILPALLGFLGAGDLRVLRLLRLLRMLKLTRHSTVFSLLWAVFKEEAHSIGALIFILSLTLTISGALAYMIESEEQPAMFNSIPAAMWWAIETLTTVGYGDMVPATVPGKLLGGLVSIVGIGTLALFSGVITVGFLDQIRLRRERASQAVPAAANAADFMATAGLKMSGPFIELKPAAETCPHCGHILATHQQNASSEDAA
jgi:voltage-gated potassium channel